MAPSIASMYMWAEMYCIILLMWPGVWAEKWGSVFVIMIAGFPANVSNMQMKLERQTGENHERSPRWVLDNFSHR